MLVSNSSESGPGRILDVPGLGQDLDLSPSSYLVLWLATTNEQLPCVRRCFGCRGCKQ